MVVDLHRIASGMAVAGVRREDADAVSISQGLPSGNGIRIVQFQIQRTGPGINAEFIEELLFCMLQLGKTRGLACSGNYPTG